MNIVKILGTAAMCAAPLSAAAAQSATTPDSGAGNQKGKWVAATGTVAGAALFLAFTKSGGTNSNGAQASDPGTSTVTPAAPAPAPAPPPAPPPAPAPQPAAPPGASATPATPPAATPPVPPAAAVSPADAPTDESAPSDTGSVTPPPNPGPGPAADNTAPESPATDEFVPTTADSTTTPQSNDPPYEDAQADFEHPSTVPEPGSLLLTATGIIGLLPLLRRRQR